MHKGSKRALALIAGLLSIALASEVGVRLLLKPPVIKGNQIPDALVGFRHQGNRHLPCSDERGTYEYRLNSEGFRGPELPREPPTTEGRVLLLGDSFVNAWGVREEDWVGTRLREELAAAGRQSTVNALCADDIGTGQELLFLGKFAPRVNPTEVVLFVYPGNDVINNSIELAGRSNVSPGDYFRPYLERDTAGSFARRYALPVRSWLRRSRLFSLLETRYLAGRSQEELLAELCPSRMKMADRILAGRPPHEYMEIFRPPAADSPWQAAWRQTEDILRGVADLTKGLGARLLVVVIPSKIQVEHAASTEGIDQKQRASHQATMEEMLDLNYPEARLESFFHEESIDHVLLLDEFRQDSVKRGSSQYILNGHLNGMAHQLMGELVARWALRSEPGVCFRPGPDSRPVPIERLAPAGPLQLDFVQDPRPELLDQGWGDWERPRAGFSGGWPMRDSGTLLVPGGFSKVTLSGSLPRAQSFPLELVLTPLQNPRRVLVRQSFDAAGPFALSFSTRTRSNRGQAWFLAKIAVDSGSKSKAPCRLRLLALSAEAPDLTPGKPGKPGK